jgi:outer membrane protein TolC
MKTAFFLCALVLLPALALADSAVCELKTAQDILDCALRHHPEVAQSEAARARDEALVRVARQRPNPELESKIVSGDESGQNVLATETSLLYTLELGGKRRARIHQASAQGELAAASLTESQELVALHTVRSLHRLRQIRSELSYLQESLTTFDRIVRQFRSRPVLPPEQAVSLSVFDLAKDEYSLRKKSLVEEETELKTFLEIATGSPYSEMKGILPWPKRSWPKILGTGETNASSSEVKKAVADLKKAEAGLSLAKSNAWPDFKLGPTVETGTLGRNDSTAFGGTISMPIPLLNLNRGEKAYAALERVRASAHLEQTHRKTSLERTKQLERYRSAVKGVSQIRLGDLNKSHHEVEEFFGRGLVPSSLVIESHRQFFEITKILHEQELTALDALWRLYIIDGRVLEEKL